MSLIESALERLRRVKEGDPRPSLPPPRPLNVVTTELKGRVAVTPISESEEPAKRATLDLNELRNRGYLPEQGLERRFADHYRHIKRALVEKALAGAADARLIMVTSALAGDGKTFTSINLALSMARERDAYVLLVDADAPKARVSEILGVRGEPGLLDALGDSTLDVESLVIATDLRGLQLLPAGKFVENATELFASARMSQIAARLASRGRRLVLFDSAPLLFSSEARALTRIPGQIVLVARAGVTPLRAAQDALAQIDRNKLQGVVLNGVPRGTGDGYYYGYGDASDTP